MSRTRKWSGEIDGERWCLEIETDKFDESGPFVVTLDSWYDEGEGRGRSSALVIVRPEEAREIAAALLAEADNAEANTARVVEERAGQ